MPVQRFISERESSQVGWLDAPRLPGAAAKSDAALAELAPKVQWVESYVADDKTFCVYLAESEDAIRQHAELSGFPASRITPIRRMIDPTTERGG